MSISTDYQVILASYQNTVTITKNGYPIFNADNLSFRPTEYGHDFSIEKHIKQHIADYIDCWDGKYQHTQEDKDYIESVLTKSKLAAETKTENYPNFVAFDPISLSFITDADSMTELIEKLIEKHTTNNFFNDTKIPVYNRQAKDWEYITNPTIKAK